MRYLITGGAGFIGSHLVDYLIDEGHEVHVLDNLSTGRAENLAHQKGAARLAFTEGSVLEEATLAPLIEACDEVFHLAAVVGVRRIMERPLDTIRTNVRGTENVLDLCSQYGKKVLLVSSSEVYGKSMGVNGGAHLREDADWTLGPTNKRRWAYACSKAIDEFLALAYHAETGHPVVVTRFFNTVGPRQQGRYGMVIPNFVQCALRGEPICVHGDGGQSRCFTHVHDAVRAAVALMRTPEAEGEVFNVGSDEEISMNALAERVRVLTESDAEIVHIPYEEAYGPGFEDMRRRTPDLAKLRAAIGYAPAYQIDDILRTVIAHYREVLVTADA